MSLLIKLPLWVWPVSLRIRCPILKRARPESHFDDMFKNEWPFFERRRPGIVIGTHNSFRKTVYIRTLFLEFTISYVTIPCKRAMVLERHFPSQKHHPQHLQGAYEKEVIGPHPRKQNQNLWGEDPGICL